MSDPLRILVCVKHVPDASADVGFADDLTLDRAGVDCRLSELDEYAVEQALQVAEAGGGAEITYLTMGPDGAAATLRKALSMGGDAGVHVLDDALHGSDSVATARVLAAAVAERSPDLVVCGMASTDGVMSVVPAMLAELLGWPMATYAGQLTVDAGARTVRVRRDNDNASELVEAALPAVVSVTDQTGEARYPSFKGIMAAKKKPLETRSLADLGVAADEVGLGASRTTVLEAVPRPPRTAGEVVTDSGDGAQRLVDFLAAQKLA